MPKTMKKDVVEEYFKRASILYLVAAIVSVVIVMGGLIFYLIYMPEVMPGPEDQVTDNKGLIESVTAPENSGEPISEELQESLNAPDSDSRASGGVLDSLSVPK